MTPGAFITVAFFGVVAALALYGLSFDVRRWLDDRDRARMVARAQRREREDDAVARGAHFDQWTEIWLLPETPDPKRRIA